MIDDVIREYFDVPKTQNMYISGRFYKKDSETDFCVVFVVGHTCRVVACKGTKYQNPVKIDETIYSEDTGKYSYPQIIRDWTGRSIIWKFERSDYYD